MARMTVNILAVAMLTFLSVPGRADDQATAANPDPWEGFNRGVFSVNDTLDRYFLKPVAQGYQFITPDVVEDGIGNVFSNLFEIRNVINDVLQWKWRQAGNDSGRFLLNSTLGIAGIFDAAQHMGLPHNDGGEDFGQTLAVWGLDSGPYLVIPILGPSTLRDGLASPVDTLADPVSYIDHVPTRNSSYGTRVVDNRAGLLKTEELLSGDRYTFIRDAYLQRRNFVVKDGAVEDDFGDDADYGYGN